MASRLDFSRDAKLEKRKKLESMGVNPHPYSFAATHSIGDARKADGKKVKIAGRVISVREHGKVTFIDLRDQSGEIQVMLRSDELGKTYDIVNLLDPGDFIGVSGKVELSKTNEITVLANSLEVLGKSLRPLPTSWQGLDDQEIRYRKRYLDMIINPAVKKTLDARWLIEKEIRRFLQDVEHYTEVETPVLQPLYGGTNARPFTTHMNALDSDYYLRVAPELYLKRLIVGGYERIFEIARNFRNEGIDHTHQPEFTMMEWYEAYADYNRIMDVAEGLIKHLAERLHGKREMQVGEQKIDLSGKWPRITMRNALVQFENVDVNKLNDEQLQGELDKRDLKFLGAFSRGKAIFSLFDKSVPAKLINPTWIIDYPKEVSPLAKQHRDNPDLVERFECYIGGKEICDGWSEVTDGLEQRRRFDVEQQHMRDGDEEAQPLDEEFLEAMEYGMPPLGGIGIGIDRLVMFLTNTWAIREVIAFPTLKPLNAQPGMKDEKKAEAKAPAQKQVTKIEPTPNAKLPLRTTSETLLETHVKNASLLNHCRMVAKAMETYAKHLGEDTELWYQTGLLHDLDWEAFPDEHPNHAINELLKDYPTELKQAVAEHAPDRTGHQPESILGKYLFACDELSGFIHAVSLMRPTGMVDMKSSSVKKKMKDKGFAKNVSRDDIERGLTLINKPFEEHADFLIKAFTK
ncbi:MAG TPA: lysine--tRNA ligase [Candidatus Saccharimonadia bacterium]|nr:lysine--tRNA ligase [Candidatus Saccharimonadia bacterium]